MMSEYSDFDFAWKKTKTEPLAQDSGIVESLHGEQYINVLTHKSIDDILRLRSIGASDDWFHTVQNNVTAYVERKDIDTSQQHRQAEVLAVAVASLQLFTQINWVGPPQQWDESGLLPNTASNEVKSKSDWKNYFTKGLLVDGEQVYGLAEHLELLCLAKIILQDCWDSLTLCQEANLWKLRCLRIHQDLLQERSPTLKKYIVECIEEVYKNEFLMKEDKYRDLVIQIHMEVGHLMNFYYESSKAEEYILTAQKLAGLDIKLTGALGKRTRFQQKEVSQLLLEVHRDNSDAAVPDMTNFSGILPKDVPLDDDTVLEAVQYSGKGDGENLQVSCVEQALLLGLLHHHKKTHEGIGDILKEECMAYINYVLGSPQCWSIQTYALLMRVQWEKDNTRRMHRSLSQLEELVNQYKRPDPLGSYRMHLIHCVQLPPKWDIERELGHFLMKIGSTKGALEVFLRLQMWEDIIKCYTELGRTEKAETVIREQLFISETPTLYCYLGDVTNDPQHYEKAWQLSKCKNARSQRSLGYYYLRKNEFTTCLAHFERSVRINSLQIGVWFSYGCAAMACSDFSLAAKAFHRCVTLESNNFEAWNNLATAYVKTNQKTRAFAALQEALKCEYDNWRLWENCSLIGADIGEFSEVIRAYHRLLDIKEKHSDPQVLGILVKVVNEDMLDARENHCAPLRPKLQELFGRLTSKVTSDPAVWKLYGELILGKSELTQEDIIKSLQYLHKAHRSSIQVMGWERELTKCKDVAQQSVELANAYIECCGKINETVHILQNLSSAKFMVKGVLSKIKLAHTDPVTQQVHTDLQGSCQQLDSHLQTIEGLIEQKKGS